MIKDTMGHNETVKPNDRQMKVLRENFPGCFKSDGSFDLERFKEFLSTEVDVTREGYELKFLGKNYARLLASLDTTTVVVPDEEHNSKPENKDSQNIYISGDNLDALKHLLKSYAGKVKCIYIDPPYNTGSDGFVYNDRFNFTVEQLVTKLSIEESQAQRILDLTTRGSASHSAWLMFMYPRLILARDLLADDGVIFISIDDNEQGNLKLICDDIFGEANFEGHVHWRRRSNQPNDKTKLIGLVAEHILVYAKSSAILKSVGVGKVPLTGKFTNPDNDARGPWATKAWKVASGQSGTRYVIKAPNGQLLDEEWMGDENTYQSLLNDNRIVFPCNGDGFPRKKYFKCEREKEGQCANNWWPGKSSGNDQEASFGSNQDATNELKQIFDNKNVFNNPKPTRLIEQIVQLGNVKDKDIVLDFFSGSASTAHAVMQLNAEDGGNRRYIVVQVPESIERERERENAASVNDIVLNQIQLLDSCHRPHTLDQIGIERIIRASHKIKEACPDTTIDLGFKHFTLQEPDATTIDKLSTFNADGFDESSLLDDFGLNTVLATWLVRDGYGFNAPVQAMSFAEYTGYYIDKHLYLINPVLRKNTIAAITDKFEMEKSFNPENVVLFGYSFTFTETASLKTNLARLRNTARNLRVNFDIRY